MKTGLFVGLITLDCIYQTDQPLGPNDKRVATAALLAAGGPATNAAVTFRALGQRAVLVGALGQHPLSSVVRDDLHQQQVDLVDLAPDTLDPPPLSSIIVNKTTGDRAVISRNAADRPEPQVAVPGHLLAQVEGVLIDGHQMALGRQIAEQARAAGIPVIIDAGSWKPGFDTVLPLATGVIASANFRPPPGTAATNAIAYLRTLGVPYCAMTQGDRPIRYHTPTQAGEMPVPAVQPVVDTLGAGDILHGAFCYFWLQTGDFVTALQQAAAVAAQSCQSFGTRQWLQTLSQ